MSTHLTAAVKQMVSPRPKVKQRSEAKESAGDTQLPCSAGQPRPGWLSGHPMFQQERVQLLLRATGWRFPAHPEHAGGAGGCAPREGGIVPQAPSSVLRSQAPRGRMGARQQPAARSAAAPLTCGRAGPPAMVWKQILAALRSAQGRDGIPRRGALPGRGHAGLLPSGAAGMQRRARRARGWRSRPYLPRLKASGGGRRVPRPRRGNSLVAADEGRAPRPHTPVGAPARSHPARSHPARQRGAPRPAPISAPHADGALPARRAPRASPGSARRRTARREARLPGPRTLWPPLGAPQRRAAVSVPEGRLCPAPRCRPPLPPPRAGRAAPAAGEAAAGGREEDRRLLRDVLGGSRRLRPPPPCSACESWRARPAADRTTANMAARPVRPLPGGRPGEAKPPPPSSERAAPRLMAPPGGRRWRGGRARRLPRVPARRPRVGSSGVGGAILNAGHAALHLQAVDPLIDLSRSA